MYISQNWLNEFVSIPTSVTARDLGLRMTMSMAEVEKTVDQQGQFEGVVVGEILSVSKHANADKLQLADVTIGSKRLHIVCGAPNIAVGQKVPVATVGTTLPNGMTIEERAVRGETSQGMLCAPDELGLGADHSGIMILDPTVKPGAPFAQALGMDDVVYEIDNKSVNHRPDLWGHYGIAREVAAILKKPLKEYTSFIKQPKKSGSKKLPVRVADAKLCPRYMGVVIEHVSVGPSPDWLRRRVELMGAQSVNNIVDVTNYVMFELGQPMHAFDRDRIAGDEIRVRPAVRGERMAALDGQTYELDQSMLVVADAQKPVAIAGIIGGADSKISESTTALILESANFDHVSVRKTSQKLGVRTESSMRFEKSLDPNLAPWALYRAIQLIQRCCPNVRVASGIADVKKFHLKQGPLTLTHEAIWNKIGEAIPIATVTDILTRLGFVVKKGKGKISITVPTWRATKDISIADDIIEEIARIYGYDNLKPVMPRAPMSAPARNRQREIERRLKNLLAYGFDMTEVYNYSFVSEKQAQLFGDDIASFMRVANPIDRELSLMRRSLVPNLFSALRANMRFFDRVSIFECASVFVPEEKGPRIREGKPGTLPAQHLHLAGIIAEKGNTTPFFTAKNVIESLIRHLRVSAEIVPGTPSPWMHPQRHAAILANGVHLGYIAEANDVIARSHKLDMSAAVFDIDLVRLADLVTDEHEYEPIPKYPSIVLDISAVLPRTVLWSAVRDVVIAQNRELIREVTLFDVYEGKGIEVGTKSVAFHIEYRSDAKTLELSEAQAVHAAVKAELEKRFSATIR